MLVKFKTIESNESKELDSSKIYKDSRTTDGHLIRFYDSNIYFTIDDRTFAYLENAWAHEGMRRVKIKDRFGWSNGLVTQGCAPCFAIEEDNGSIGIWNFESVTFIPYKMEETNG